MKKEITVTGFPFVSHVNQSLRPTLTTDFLNFKLIMGKLDIQLIFRRNL